MDAIARHPEDPVKTLISTKAIYKELLPIMGRDRLKKALMKTVTTAYNSNKVKAAQEALYILSHFFANAADFKDREQLEFYIAMIDHPDEEIYGDAIYRSRYPLVDDPRVYPAGVKRDSGEIFQTDSPWSSTGLLESGVT